MFRQFIEGAFFKLESGDVNLHRHGYGVPSAEKNILTTL